MCARTNSQHWSRFDHVPLLLDSIERAAQPVFARENGLWELIAIDALLEHRNCMLKEGHAGVELVFCDQAGGPLRRQNVERRSFKPLLTKAECPKIRFQDLRHTYATLALANGVPIRVVSDTMRHSRSSVTIDTYAHLLPSQERLAADKVESNEFVNLVKPRVSADRMPTISFIRRDKLLQTGCHKTRLDNSNLADQV